MPNQTSNFAFLGFFFASFYVRTNIFCSYSFLLRQKLKKFKSPSVNMFGESLHRALKVHLSGSGLSQVGLVSLRFLSAFSFSSSLQLFLSTLLDYFIGKPIKYFVLFYFLFSQNIMKILLWFFEILNNNNNNNNRFYFLQWYWIGLAVSCSCIHQLLKFQLNIFDTYILLASHISYQISELERCFWIPISELLIAKTFWLHQGAQGVTIFVRLSVRSFVHS